MGSPDTDDIEVMSDLEAMMWALEADPHLSSNFANLTIFDTELDFDRLRQRLWRATRRVPRLRRRIDEGFGPLPPRWIDDPDFDIDHHLRRIRLPDGAAITDLYALATRLVLEPFDRGHPLWEFVVIDGLEGGRSAMVQKLHHTITDGKGGIKMSIEFIDLERDAPPPPPVDDGPPPPLAPPASLVGEALAAVGEMGRRNSESWRRLVGSAADLVRDPGHLASLLVGLPADSKAMVKSMARQFGVFDGHRSPLWSERSLTRSFHVHRVPLDEVQRVARALGGSVNDLFVAAAAGGAGAYHRDRGASVEELRMSMPVSTRTRGDVGGNAFTPTRVLVPVGSDPAARFDEIHRRLGVTKTERSLGFIAQLASLARLVPQPVLVRIARQQVMTVDFTTSNLQAAPFDLYIAGGLIEGNYPLGPLVGTAWNLTTMSYRGELHLGLHVDARAVADPALLADAIWDGFEEMLALA